MPYRAGSVEAKVLEGDEGSIDLVRRWIVDQLTAPRFWKLRNEWRDMTQEVLARVVQSLRTERFRPEGEFKSYVQGICRHTAQQRLEGGEFRGRTAQVEASSRPAEGRDPEDEAMRRQLVRRALDLSTVGCRDLILAYFGHELTYDEMAARFALPTGTVKSRLFRCLECVRKMMADARGGGRGGERRG